MADGQRSAPAGPSPADTCNPWEDAGRLATLPRVLGPFDAVTVVIGSIIGSGIFLKVDTIARHMGSFGPIVAVWVVGGLAALCGSLALAELAAMLPRAGGPYVYLRHAYGRLTAFLWGWTEFSIIRTGSLGSLACGTVIYFNRFLESVESQGMLPPRLAELVPISHLGQGLLTVVSVVCLCSINIAGTRWAAWTQNVTTIFKLSFLGLLMAAPLLLGQARVENLRPIGPAGWGLDFWRAFGLALVAVFWPYDGWPNIGPVAEEIRHPQRNVPLALGTGMLTVIGVYVAANFGYHLALPMERVQQTQAIAADVMGALWGRWGVTIAALGVMISTFGALNANILAGPRVYFAVARDGLLPKALRQVHARFRTPANAIASQGAWSLLQIVVVFALLENPKQAFDRLTDFVILGGAVFYGLTVAAVFVLRYRLPDLERPYRTWGYPVTPLLYLLSVGAVIGSIALSNLWQVAAAAGLLLGGTGVYRFFCAVESRNPAR